MIHVEVRKSDIRKGRLKASKTCGCPIWHALARSLNKIVPAQDTPLIIPKVTFAKFQGFKILLPPNAVKFQIDLMHDFSAPVEPFEFDADVVVK